MRIISAVIEADRKLAVSPSDGFVGEQNAEMIAINIGPFADENYDFFVLNFDNGISGGMFPSNVISTADDKPAYIDNGVIYCPIDASHTVSGNLKIQLEAHKTFDGRVTVKKSSVACISFGESLMGQVNAPCKTNPVYERLADAEGRIASAESRISDIEKENFGAKIEGVDSRISVLEGYDIPEKYERIGQRIDDLENDFENFDAITSIPAADDKNLGGVKVSQYSDVFVNGNGFLGLRYGNVDMHSLSVLITLALLNESGRVETVVGNTADEITSVIYGQSMQIVSKAIEAVAFAAFEGGEITWFDENYEAKSASVIANSVYVLKLVDGRMNLKSYSGNELKNLILGGI